MEERLGTLLPLPSDPKEPAPFTEPRKSVIFRPHSARLQQGNYRETSVMVETVYNASSFIEHLMSAKVQGDGGFFVQFTRTCCTGLSSAGSEV
jgi:hypothetical protein